MKYRIALCLAALLLASGAWGQSLSQQRHDDEIRRQQCESDGGTWGNVRTCTDKKRVLLMSEDGRWHCYDFARLDQ